MNFCFINHSINYGFVHSLHHLSLAASIYIFLGITDDGEKPNSNEKLCGCGKLSFIVCCCWARRNHLATPSMVTIVRRKMEKAKAFHEYKVQLCTVSLKIRIFPISSAIVWIRYIYVWFRQMMRHRWLTRDACGAYRYQDSGGRILWKFESLGF